MMSKVFSRPAIWVMVGIGVGVLGAYSVTHRAGIPSAQARPQVRGVSALASSTTTESLSALRTLDSAFKGLVDLVTPSVVNIRIEKPSGQDVEGRRVGRALGEGSGVIFRSDGWIMTNDHVVGGMDKVKVILNDGREFTGTVRRSNDPQIDIAVVKIEGQNLPAALLGDSSKVKPGQFAIAIGSPFGYENTVTVGHISGLSRPSQVQDPNFGLRSYAGLIQTDASINPGNSGGPLMNIDGEVIGINTTIVSTPSFGMSPGGNIGIGFAIPSNQAKLVAEILIEKGKLHRGYLGVFPQNLKPFEKKKFNIENGTILRQVPNNGPAYEAGLRENDIVTKVNDTTITDEIDLRNALLRYGPGSNLKVEYVRNGHQKTVDMKVAAPPKEASLDSREVVDQNGKKWKIDPKGRGPRIFTPDEFFKDGPFKDWNFDFNDEEFRRAEKGRKPVDPQAKSYGKPRLGVTVEKITDTLRKQYNIPAEVKGVVVTSVTSGSLAEKVGMKAGDVIEEFNGKAIENAQQLSESMSEIRPGDQAEVRFTRFEKKNGMSTSFTKVLPLQF